MTLAVTPDPQERGDPGSDDDDGSVSLCCVVFEYITLSVRAACVSCESSVVAAGLSAENKHNTTTVHRAEYKHLATYLKGR